MPAIWSFEGLWIKFLKWQLSLLTGYAPTASANSGYDFFFIYDRKIQIWILVMWLQSVNHEGWNQLKGQFEER